MLLFLFSTTSIGQRVKLSTESTSRVLMGTKRFLKIIHEISWYLDSPDSSTAMFLLNGCSRKGTINQCVDAPTQETAQAHPQKVSRSQIYWEQNF